MEEKNNDNLRHSCAHLLAAAVMELWPKAKRAIGPAIENGFYFDFDFGDVKISEADFPQIESKMREIVKSWKGFERQELTFEEAKAEYPDNPYKHELIEEFAKENEKLSFYKSGDYQDLCRGGHCPHPNNDIKHFKLLSVAGAYWRGNEKNPMLTRIYGTSFKTRTALDEYLNLLEEAKKRDHRKIGAEMDLFAIDEVVGKGLILWLPKGTIIREQVENLAKEMEDKDGYTRVITPHIAKEELFTTSGHLPYYKDSMYPAMEMDDGTYYLKSMNCPLHHKIFQSRPRSYRDMPIRLAEYGTVYRNELSGTLAGLLRVRGMSMNDAHIYVTREQIEDEFKKVLNLTKRYFEVFGLNDYWFRLSKWSADHPEKYINEPENWKFAEDILRKVLEEEKVKFVEASDEAAFYGPKVDVQFKSVIGREETMSTIQLDFMARARFELKYTDSTGNDNNEVFVIHRAPLSTHERFMAFLIEHYAGKFPLWLAPVQVAVLPVSEKSFDYAKQVVEELEKAHLRVELDMADSPIGAKIREATLQKIPYQCIIGEKEIEKSRLGRDNFVSVRSLTGEQSTEEVSSFIERLKQDIEKRK